MKYRLFTHSIQKKSNNLLRIAFRGSEKETRLHQKKTDTATVVLTIPHYLHSSALRSMEINLDTKVSTGINYPKAFRLPFAQTGSTSNSLL